MAIQFFDGFDDYGTANQTAYQSLYVINGFGNPLDINSSLSGAFGGYAVGCTNGGGQLEMQRRLSAPVSTFILGGRFLFSSSTNAGIGFTFSDTSNDVIAQVQVILMASPTAAVSATSNGNHMSQSVIVGTALGAAGNVQLGLNNWYELEAELTVGTGTSGALVVKINGITVLNYTGINTQGTAGPTIGYAGVFSYAAGNCWWDDLYGLDTTGAAPYNTFLTAVAGAMGPRVYTAPGIADDGVTWTPNSGTNNYSLTSELSFDGDTTYVSTATAGNIDLYNIAALTGNSVVLAAQTTFVARQDDTGTREVAGIINSGGTNYAGATRAMTANYQKFVDLWANDPATGAAWAASKFTGTPSVHGGYECIV
jgi:hypothetical protein